MATGRVVEMSRVDQAGDKQAGLWLRVRSRSLRAIELWHLLSLDAPTVAVVWTWAVARSNHLRLPITALAAMGTAVWMLYAADRLLDGRELGRRRNDGLDGGFSPDDWRGSQTGEIEARHRFHFEHRRGFRFGILAASVGLAGLLPQLPVEAMRLYLVLGGLVAGYFVVIHAGADGLGLNGDGPRGILLTQARGSGQRLPKEIAVGVFFAAAVFIPTVARVPELRLRLLPEALLLGVLCSLNCLYIYRWEHSTYRSGQPVSRPAHAVDSTEPSVQMRSRTIQDERDISSAGPCVQDALPVHGATRLALRVLPGLAVGLVVAGLVLAGHSLLSVQGLVWVAPFACALSSGLLLALDRLAPRLDRTTLRASADLCLLTPLLLLPWLLNR